MIDDYQEAFLAACETQRAFAANFLRRQLPRYEAELGQDAARSFIRWWTASSPYIGLAAETQREFDGAAHYSCDFWLNGWAQRKTRRIVTGEGAEAAPSPDDEAAQLRAKWGVTKNQALRIPPSVPQKAWRPCKHWDTTPVKDGEEDERRMCPNCAADREGMVGQYSEQIQSMYDQHRRFVWKQLHERLRVRTSLAIHPEFYDIESKVWTTVNVRIAGYDDRGQPLAWLKSVIHSTVEDYFKEKYRTKRGALVTSNTTDGDGDKLYQEQDGTQWSGKVTPEGSSADADEHDPWEIDDVVRDT